MLINNKLKQWLCGESYGSNSERKKLKLDLDELKKEISIFRPKKKHKPLYEIWNRVTISVWKLKDPKQLYNKFNIEWQVKWWLWKIELEVVGWKTTKAGKRYYMWKILAMIPDKCSIDVDTSPVVWETIIFSI